MSVAANPVTEQVHRNPQQQFAIGSGIGAFAIVAALGLIFGALPLYWSEGWDAFWANSPDMKKNLFLADALLILIELAVIVGIAVGAYKLLQTQTQPGVRAGMVLGAVFLLICLLAAFWIGGRLEENNFAEGNSPVGWALMALIVAVPVGFAVYACIAFPAVLGAMESLEHLGFFHGVAYKGNQGVRVRRGTIVGILAVGVTGIITMVTHRMFGYERPDFANDWYWTLPFTNPPVYVYLMFKIHLLMPIVLGVLLLWFGWRIVNMPAFADFLIATEAEMNKVSWTNRHRLMQDTVVVLVTVFLFTMFLFVVDVIWIKVLNAPFIHVLMIDPKEKEKAQQETAKW